MKRILYLLASVACVLAGCTLEPTEGLLDSNAPVFTASYAESGATRTQLADNQTSVLWSEGDEISVFDGNRANHEYLSSGPGKVTVFNLKGSETVEPADRWIALYPYDPNAELMSDADSVSTVLKSVYNVSRPGTFAEGMNLAIAQTTESSLKLGFKNTLSYIAVAIKGASDVTRLTFRGNNDEVVAGSVNIPFDLGGARFAARTGVNVYKSITVNIQHFEESTSREEARYYYIPVLPNYAFENGFSVDVTKGDGRYTYTYDKAVTFTRGEKRTLFIEIPGAGSEGYIPLEDLTGGKVLQFTTNPHQNVNGQWESIGRLYPDTHADIAYAQWTWDPEAYDYPRSSATYNSKVMPIFTHGTKENKLYNLVLGAFKDHALVFSVPVASIPSGSTLSLKFKMQAARRVPKGWTVEISLDGSTWNAMNLTAADPNHVYQTIREKDSSSGEAYDLVAPFIFTKENATPQIEATYTVSEDITNTVVRLRIRALTFRVAGSSDTAETYYFSPGWHGSYYNLYLVPVDSAHPGIYLSVR